MSVEELERSQKSYEGREQSFFKHYVLENYLERLAFKTMMWGVENFNYIDCFAGPWQSEEENFSDTSPKKAIEKLQKVKADLIEKGKSPNIRFVFIEKNIKAFGKLSELLQPYQNHIEIKPCNNSFEESIPLIQDFINHKNKQPFSFFFIDPTGWTGFGMDQIRNLLKDNRGEVLINLMTKDIRRFVNEDGCNDSFIRLFGQERAQKVLDKVSCLQGQKKVDEIVKQYCLCIKELADYTYVASAVILNPLEKREHFHLIYGTRSLVGLQVFKEIEEKLMTTQKTKRAAIREESRKTIDNCIQGSLFGSKESLELLSNDGYVDSLISNYQKKGKLKIQAFLEKTIETTYDDLFAFALQLPMVSQRYLKEILQEWKQNNLVNYELSKAKNGGERRVPNLQKGDKIFWKKL